MTAKDSTQPQSGAGTVQERSYRMHAEGYQHYVADEAGRKMADTWFRDDSADAWLHLRMFRCIDPVVQEYPESRWMTVGDGRFGKDAHYLEQKGAKVLATDISDKLLAQGRARGFIQEYQVENAEALTFADESFDFVLCKDAFHHFPRPMIALYEMLRVARQGVLLIEPSDHPVLLAPRGILFKAIKALAIRCGMGRRFNTPDTHIIEYNDPAYEEGGNFVYGLSEREVEKAAMALNLPHVAFKDLNTFYMKGAEFEKADESSAVFRAMQAQIVRRDRRCGRGLNLAAHDILVALILKAPMAPTLRSSLTARGYRIRDLPRNPHLQ